MENNRRSIQLLTLEDSDSAEGVNEKTGDVSMQIVTKGTQLLEATCENTHVDELPLDVRTGKQAIATNDLSRLCAALCGNMDKEYDSDDSLISEIDGMDTDELAAISKKYKENIEKANKNKKTSKTIASILAMSKTKDERKQPEKIEEENNSVLVSKKRKVADSQETEEDESKKSKKELSYVEIDLPTPVANPPVIKKIAPMKTRSQRKKTELSTPKNDNKKLDTWLTSKKMDESVVRKVSEEADKVKKARLIREKSEAAESDEDDTIHEIFRQGDSKDLLYLKCEQLVKILEIAAEMVNEIEHEKVEDEEEEGLKKLTHYVKSIDHLAFINKIMFIGVETNFWTDELSHSEYLLKNIAKMVKKDLKKIFCGEKYGFHLTPSECLYALRAHYISKIPKKDNGKSTEPLDIDPQLLIKACYTVKKQFHRDYEPNDAVRRVILTEK